MTRDQGLRPLSSTIGFEFGRGMPRRGPQEIALQTKEDLGEWEDQTTSKTDLTHRAAISRPRCLDSYGTRVVARVRVLVGLHQWRCCSLPPSALRKGEVVTVAIFWVRALARHAKSDLRLSEGPLRHGVSQLLACAVESTE